MKILRNIILTIFVITLIPSGVFAKGFLRENNFMDKSGSERTAEIKKFQARMNLPITGTLNENTKNALYTQNYEVYDEVKAPTKGRWIAVNKSRRILTMYEGTNSIGKFPVTLGTNATPTPSGKGKIQNKHTNPAWGGMGGKYTPRASDDPLNPLGERWMGLNIPGASGYGIHGNIKPNQIGGYYSNGCIRMYNYDIETFVFPKMSVGAPVYIGTDSELESWGIYQYSRIKKDTPKAPVKVEDKKPEVEKQEVNTEEVYKTEDLLDF